MHKYTVEEKLGEGFYGTVHRGRCKQTAHPCAVKRVPIPRAQDGLPLSTVRELFSLQRLSGHPNVVRLYEAFPHGSELVLVTELCRTDVRHVIDAYTPHVDPMPMRLVRALMVGVLRSLAHCHGNALMHRDVKPSNLLVGYDDEVKLCDFGLTRTLLTGDNKGNGKAAERRRSDDDGDVETAPPMTHEVATRWYRAPELLFGLRSYTHAVDMWGAGCLLAEMLSGGSGGTGNGAVLFPGVGDIDQITKIFRVLGTPTDETVPSLSTWPDWGKVVFPHSKGEGLASVVGGDCMMANDDDDQEESASSSSSSRAGSGGCALDLLGKLLCMDPERRITAREALRHPFLSPAVAEKRAALRRNVRSGVLHAEKKKKPAGRAVPSIKQLLRGQCLHVSERNGNKKEEEEGCGDFVSQCMAFVPRARGVGGDEANANNTSSDDGNDDDDEQFDDFF